MKFTTTRRTGTQVSFAEAVLAGYPHDGGIFVPSGSADLRAAIYFPEIPYSGTLLGAMMTLLPEDFDPVEAELLVERIFPRRLSPIHKGNILHFDLCTGKSGSRFDCGAALLSAAASANLTAIPAGIRSIRGIPFLVPFPGGDSPDARTARALIAVRDSLPGDLILLLPTDFPSFPARRMPDFALPDADARASSPGGVSGIRVFRTECPKDELRDLVRAIAAQNPGSCIPVTAENPAFLMASLILETALFAEAKKDFSGEIYAAHSSLDASSLGVGLWAWGLGLPVTGFVLGARPGTSFAFSEDPVVADFETIKPGILSSIAFFEEIPNRVDSLSPPSGDLASAGAVSDDSPDSAESIATEAALAAIRSGSIASSPDSTRILVRRTWDPHAAAATDLAVYAAESESIEASVPAMAEALKRFRR